MKKKIEDELNDLYDFVSAEENKGSGWSMAQAYDRIERLEKFFNFIFPSPKGEQI